MPEIWSLGENVTNPKVKNTTLHLTRRNVHIIYISIKLVKLLCAPSTHQ